jgi:PleD family two-component response regulator
MEEKESLMLEGVNRSSRLRKRASLPMIQNAISRQFSHENLQDVFDFRPRKYLVVDDTPSNSKMLSMVLKSRNIECDIAENGQEAVGNSGYGCLHVGR